MATSSNVVAGVMRGSQERVETVNIYELLEYLGYGTMLLPALAVPV
jgi:hypothetical protein